MQTYFYLYFGNPSTVLDFLPSTWHCLILYTLIDILMQMLNFLFVLILKVLSYEINLVFLPKESKLNIYDKVIEQHHVLIQHVWISNIDVIWFIFLRMANLHDCNAWCHDYQFFGYAFWACNSKRKWIAILDFHSDRHAKIYTPLLLSIQKILKFIRFNSFAK